MLQPKQSFLTSFSRFFFTPKSNDWIVFFRISIGTLILAHFIAILPDFKLLYSEHGVIPTDILSVFTPNYALTFTEMQIWITHLGLSTVVFNTSFKLLYAALALLIIFGIWPRINSLILLFLHVSLMNTAPYFSYGVDYFTSMSLFYLILIPSSQKFKWNYCSKYLPQLNISPYFRLFQIHISIAYFFSGLLKLTGFNWRNGESIWKAINLPYANLDFGFEFSYLGHFPWLFIAIGWLTISIELLYPIFIWWKKTRKLWLYLTISMHLGIALILNLYYFSAIMIIWNLTAFYFSSVPIAQQFSTKPNTYKLIS